ncbi:MAG: 50S ribosomal protein L20 [Haliscomenobacter sp.]|nr:50S ribosomal protein L20 [Haliscomenobacter sp.]MBK8652585.1 50S ribosomal protein L20 [Haliscomenobacter sp.]MBP9076719.1 50S ribosomal protein L20 [Haliscomenobacter sp.]
MPRSVNSVASRKRRKKILKASRGFFGARRNVLTAAKNTLDKGWGYAFRDRRAKKRAYRRLWIARINAGARTHGISYSRLMHHLSENDIQLNRKVLADLALNHPEAFQSVVESVK